MSALQAPMVGQGPMGGLNGARPPFPGMPLPPNMMPPSGMNPSARPFIPSVEPPSIVSVPQAVSFLTALLLLTSNRPCLSIHPVGSFELQNIAGADQECSAR